MAGTCEPTSQRARGGWGGSAGYGYLAVEAEQPLDGHEPAEGAVDLQPSSLAHGPASFQVGDHRLGDVGLRGKLDLTQP